MSNMRTAIVGASAAAVDEAGHLSRRLGLHAGDDVGVLLEREGRRLVAEPFADHL